MGAQGARAVGGIRERSSPGWGERVQGADRNAGVGGCGCTGAWGGGQGAGSGETQPDGMGQVGQEGAQGTREHGDASEWDGWVQNFVQEWYSDTVTHDAAGMHRTEGPCAERPCTCSTLGS